MGATDAADLYLHLGLNPGALFARSFEECARWHLLIPDAGREAATSSSDLRGVPVGLRPQSRLTQRASQTSSVERRAVKLASRSPQSAARASYEPGVSARTAKQN